jgi:hypothetical protein
VPGHNLLVATGPPRASRCQFQPIERAPAGQGLVAVTWVDTLLDEFFDRVLHELRIAVVVKTLDQSGQQSTTRLQLSQQQGAPSDVLVTL